MFALINEQFQKDSVRKPPACI